MFKLFTFLFHTFPLILAWLYLLVAIFCVVVHIKQIKSKAKVSIGQWAFSVLNVFDDKSYVIASAVSELYVLTMMSVIGYLTYYLAWRNAKPD